MKILIETECGETTCGKCAAFVSCCDQWCGLFDFVQLKENRDREFVRCPACLAKYPHPDSGMNMFELNAQLRQAREQLASQNLEDE